MLGRFGIRNVTVRAINYTLVFFRSERSPMAGYLTGRTGLALIRDCAGLLPLAQYHVCVIGTHGLAPPSSERSYLARLEM